MFKLFSNELYAGADSGGSGGDTLHPATSTDLLDELMKDDDEIPAIDLDDKKSAKVDDDDDAVDDKKDDKKAAKVEDDADEDEDEDKDKDEADKELEELEKELAGPDEKQLESMTPARRKDILTKYPKLFKDFPYLETAYYRDQKFTEAFPTIKEAEEAVLKIQEFDTLSGKLKSGDIESVITDISKDEKSFHKLVDNYLPLLSKVSPQAYHHIVGNLLKYTVQEMVTEGNAKSNDSLKTAATILHDFIFGTTKWTPPTSLSQNVRPENRQAEDDLAKREREFADRKFNSAQMDIAGRVDNAIKATIVQHIDPTNQMTDFVKNAAIDKALKQVEGLISKDTRFKTLLDRLWQNAAEKDFSKSEMDKIKSACISKARTLLPSVVKTARHEALKGLGKRNKTEDKEEKPDTDTSAKGNSAAPRSSGKGRSDKSAPQAGESSLDFLMRD